MSNPPKISIAVACDNHYLIMLAALLKSIEVNHNSSEHIDVWIIEDDIKKKNKIKLESSLDPVKFTLIWICQNSVIPKDIHLPFDKNTYPLNIYMRLFIPYFIPDELKKVLYLDVDMIFTRDISELWNTNIDNHIAAAVTDSTCVYIKNNIQNYKELNLPGDAKYFNSGLLLMNIDRWKEHEITLKVIKTIDQNREYTQFSDQYGLNVILVNQWLELDPLWNYYADGKHPLPFNIHFFHRKPFYKSYFNSLIYRDIFYSYLNQTKWINSKPVGETKRYFIKISNVMEKFSLYVQSLIS